MGLSDSLPPNSTYSVCGLRVRSDRSIPDLILAESDNADVEITFQEYPKSSRFDFATLRYSSRELALNGEPAVRLFEIASPAFLYQLNYADGTTFVVNRAGSRVWASWRSESTFEDTLTYLLGPVLGFLLRLRGVTCLHASAIAIDGVAIALTGPGGAGKSTAAAQFASMGYPVLSDDIATLEEAGSSFLVQPSLARLRLWPSSVQHLYGHPEALPRLTPSWEKQYLDLRTGGRSFHSTPLPLAAIYILNNAEGAADDIEELPRAATMMKLVANVYVNYLLESSFRELDFIRIARVANTLPVRQVNLQHDFAALERICQSVVADLHHFRSRLQLLPAGGSSPSVVSCLS
jgi:hypothetical protein